MGFGIRGKFRILKLRAGESGQIMIDDFNICGGIPRIEWPEPGDNKLGPFSFKSVSIVYLFQFMVVYGMDF